jgi:hypothetical protein
MVERKQRRRRLGTVAQCAGLMLLFLGASGWAQKIPEIALPPSYTLEILHPIVSQKGSVVSVSGSVRRSNPWAKMAWGYLELSLLDKQGNVIKKVPVGYFPRALNRTYHSANEPLAFFGVNVDVGNQIVATVRIVYHD